MDEVADLVAGYCDPISVRPGETVRFMLSCAQPSYTADLVRIVCGDRSSKGAGFEEHVVPDWQQIERPGRVQAVNAGSYGRASLPAAQAGRGVTFAAAIWPTLVGRGAQTILTTQIGPDTEARLEIDERGSARLAVGDQTVTTELALAGRRWVLVAGGYDDETGEAWICQSQLDLSLAARADDRSDGRTARLAAGLARTVGPDLGVASSLGGSPARFNGKIAAPRILAAGEPRHDVRELVEGDDFDDLVVAWDFARDTASDTIVDTGPNAAHGYLVNVPGRAVTSWRWDASHQCWQDAPSHYDAIHFHDDDLGDAEWETDVELVVPDGLPSGVYALRVSTKSGSVDRFPFFVLPDADATKNDVAFLASTSTYIAYANQRLHLGGFGLFTNSDTPLGPEDRYLLDHPETLSTYEHHRDGSGVAISSRLRPIVNFKPGSMMWSFNADTNVTAWLERTGEQFDVLTDEDLHYDGAAALAGHRVLITGTHPEYWTTAMLDALEGWLAGGGRLMYLGGNGFYWRVAHHPDRRGIIEVRRAEDGTRAWEAQPGEYYHQFTGEFGGMWRRLGRAPNRLVGVGFAAQGFGRSAAYEVNADALSEERVAFALEGLQSASVLGDFGSVGGGAAGQEIDRYDTRLGSPEHAVVIASATSHSRSMLRVKEEFLASLPAFDDPGVRADVVFFELPGGGAVFSVGSITWAGSLAHEGYVNDIATLTSNVLRRFRSPEPFVPPKRKASR